MALSASLKGLVLAAVVLLAVACGDTTQSDATPCTPTCPLVAPSATQSSAPTPSVAPAPIPTPVSAQTAVAFLNAPLSVPHGQNATLNAMTAANTSCAIEVDYSSGASSATGLVTKNSNGAGAVGWTWKVGVNTTRGVWPITVTCGSGSAQTHITVT